MARAENRSTLQAAAKESRLGHRASRRSGGDRPMQWRRSLRRARRAIDSSERLIDSSRRFIRVSEGCAARRPRQASRQLERAACWLNEAEGRLLHAAHALRKTADDAGHSPECDRETVGRLVDATERWVSSIAQMAALHNRLDNASSLLLAAVTVGAVTFDLPGLENDSRQKAAAPRLITGRLLLEIRLPRESGRIRLISIRRQRSRPVAFAEAARRVFRGRAPPHAAICSL